VGSGRSQGPHRKRILGTAQPRKRLNYEEVKSVLSPRSFIGEGEIALLAPSPGIDATA